MPALRGDDDDSSASSKKVMVHSRRMTRLGQMYWNPGKLLKRVKPWQRKDEAGRKALEDAARTNEDKQLYALIKLFADLEPDIVEELAQGGRGARALTELTEQQLCKGQSNAKAEDMRKVRGLLGVWCNWATRPDAEDSSTRGLHNPETAFLLTPIGLDWDNLDVRQKFMNGEIEISELDVPRFCYPAGKGNPNKPWVDAFCSELLIKGAQAIILSPGASKNPQPASMTAVGSRGHRRAAKSRSAVGLAKRYEMVEVTTPLIAYVTVVVRHALTSDKDYSDEGSGFDYELFYNEIREFLEDPKHARITAKIVKLWNDEIFANLKRRKTTGGNPAERKGTRAALDAALEAGEDLGLGDEADEN
ncbi:hypothetical protein FRC12_009251 [Ceratobasidium sp. 428]|nr:hypothetical protein FRC12_009251 [Ceratobasidium sp. 428]